MFKGLATGCLKSSIGIIGKDSDFHKTPGKYGTLPVKVNSITGVDIPVMVYVDDNEKNKNETIAIIAQDPLRNTEDKKLQPFAPNYPNPIVGTPFALHYDSRCYPQTVVYRKIICERFKYYFIFESSMSKWVALFLYLTLLPQERAYRHNRVWQRATGISPLRGSLRAAPYA